MGERQPGPFPRALPPRTKVRRPLLPSQDVELAHRELLRSLAGESGGTTPVGSFHTEAAGWTDSSLSPPARETLASDSRDSHQPGPCSEDGERGSVLCGGWTGSSSSLSP